jgi:hypothetical protein
MAMAGPLEPDRNQIEIFIDALFRQVGTSGYVSLRSFYDDRNKEPLHNVPVPLSSGLKTLFATAVTVATSAASNPRPVVFCPPIAVFSDRTHAREQDLLAGPALSVECDARPQQARQKLEAILGPATIVVRSGGRWTNGNGEIEDRLHLHWRLKEPAEGEDLKKLKKARDLAARLVGADPTNKTIVHPLRWPGSWHRKAEPRLCEIESCNPDIEIDLDDALARLIEIFPANYENASTSNAGSERQSGENTWTDLIGGIVNGEKLHPLTVPFAAKLIAAGTNEGAAINIARAAMEISAAPRDARWQSRYDDLPRLVRSARKFAPPPGPLFDPWAEFVVPPFPLDILPAVAHDFVVEQSILIGCDPAAIAMAVLATFSAALSHRFALRMMRNGQWWENPRLWVLLVGGPSQKKTPIFNAVSRPIVEHQDHLYQQYQAKLQDYQAAKENDKDSTIPEPGPPPRLVGTDVTIEKLADILARSERGLLIKRDEVAGWIGGMEKYATGRGPAADRGFWLQAFDGGPYHVDRVKRGETYVRNLSVSLLGGIQPARLAELHGLTTDGLLQRFLPVMMGPSQLASDEPGDNEAYSTFVHHLIFAKPERLILSDAALEVMYGLRRNLHDLEGAAAGLADSFQTFIGKLPGYAGRLALILHMAADPEHGQTYAVGETTADGVHKLILDFIVPHAHEFYRTAESATDGDRLRKLASWILTSGKTRIRAADLTSSVRDLRGLSVFDLNKRVSPLVAGEWLEPIEPGPLCRAWTVNPALSSLFEKRRQQENDRKAQIGRIMEKSFGARREQKKTPSDKSDTDVRDVR